MNGAAPSTRSFSVEELLTTLAAQLDRAQDTLALKVSTGRPLTWALRDLALELKVFVELSPSGDVRLRHAGPNEAGASTVNLNMASITRPMIEENTISLARDEDPRPLQDLSDGGLSDEDRQRLDRLGVRTVGQFRRLVTQNDPDAVRAVTGTPMDQLQAALVASSRPAVSRAEPTTAPGRGRLLRIRGANFTAMGRPEVRLGGEPVEVLESTANALLVRPLGHHKEGQVEVVVGRERATGWYRLPGSDDADERQERDARQRSDDRGPAQAATEGER